MVHTHQMVFCHNFHLILINIYHPREFPFFQKNLHSLIQRLKGGETADAVRGEGLIGVLNDGVEADIDLRPVSHVKLDEIKYTVASPLKSELPETSFSRDVLLNNPEQILTSLQESGAVSPSEDLDELR